MELCGGAGRVSQIIVRRKFTSGGNWDLVTNCDLNDPATQRQCIAMIKATKPLVVIMAPTCTPFGPWANLNYNIHYDGWLKSYQQAAPHGRFCGEVAKLQHESGRFFLNEQPFPSWLYEEQPWPSVLKLPGVVSLVIHQCMTDQRASCGNLAKKPTGFVANSPILLKPLQRFKCDNSHPHADLSGGKSRPLQLWTWKLATAIADGICALIKQQKAKPTFPVAATNTEPPTPDDELPVGSLTKEPWRLCPGCLHRKDKHDKSHTRVPHICKHPLEEDVEWTCPGCKKHANISHKSHNYKLGQCKWFESEDRMQGKPRKGKHPRPPKQNASRCQTSNARAQDEDGTDYGLPHPDDSDYEDHATARGSTDNPHAPRKQFKDAATGNTATTDDWTRFDVLNSLRALRSGKRSVIIRELRKLHLRWWHGTVSTMTSTLRAAGIPNSVNEMVPNIIKTCRECQKWASPGNTTVPSITLATSFNEHVEFDLLFYKTHIVFHLICRATRWHATKEIHDKTTETLLNCLVECWISIHGPMQNLHMDGESGMCNDTAKAFLMRNGIKQHIRAPGQHATFIERAGAILRCSMHISETQAEKEGITITFPILLGENTFSKNAMCTIGPAGSTAYQAVYGRQPGMLPPLEPNSTGDSVDGRKERRIREIALSSMCQVSALNHVVRALSTKTQQDGATLYKPGDLIDYHRPPTDKDLSGWHGPVPVVRNLPEKGQVIIHLNGRDFPNRYQDTRHTLLIILLAFDGITNNTTHAKHVLLTHMSQMQPGSIQLFGLNPSPEGNLVPTRASSQHKHITQALAFIARNVLQITDAIAVRIGRGIRRFGRYNNATHQCTVWWKPNDIDNAQMWLSNQTEVDLKDRIGIGFETAYTIQVLCAADAAGALDSINDQNDAELQRHINTPDHELQYNDTPNQDVNDRLSTITEEDPEDEHLWMTKTMFTYFAQHDPSLTPDLIEACQALHYDDTTKEQSTTIEEPIYMSTQLPAQIHSTDIHEYQHYMTAGVNVSLYAQPATDADGQQCIEFECHPNIRRCFMDDTYMTDNQTVLIQIFVAGNKGPKKSVIERDTDLLTKEELAKHYVEVNAAILEEMSMVQIFNISDCP